MAPAAEPVVCGEIRALIALQACLARAVAALAATALVVFGAQAADTALACRPPLPVERAQLGSVIDGDTLALSDGRHVRLIGVNAPERARRGKPAEPGADQARDFARQFLGRGGVHLSEGKDSRDRYERTLAHVFRDDQRSLEQALLEAGLARVAIVPPNIELAGCLLRAEDRARAAHAGLWASGAFSPRSTQDLAGREGGFRLLRGRLGSVVSGGSSWWVELDNRVVLQISRADKHNFDLESLRALEGREVEVRGWMGWRDAAANRAPWVMRLGHPMALRALPPGA